MKKVFSERENTKDRDDDEMMMKKEGNVSKKKIQNGASE